MDKLSWAKYHFSIWIVAICVALMSKFVTSNVLILIPFSLGLYYFSVKGFSKVKGY
ncbi:hypothetical protein [Dyadobacter sp. CY326]|uniref:hypothetical protein n=1 Tax=Dyadobacter sp. CY326 TaxID=2907300 RepID=UPI001F2CCCFA|nr:hypothetical protein [Dyadobacter sp. CY326]MCE7064900.1 hypothetical protein [Dyadobacter sp. CY326]